MTLLDKLTCLYKSGLALLLIPFFFACNDPSELGLQVPDEDDVFEVQKAEFTLPVSTISIDSLRTSGGNLSTFGQYADPNTGKVTATTYNRIHLAGGHLPDSTDVFVKAYIRLWIRDFKANNSLAGEEISFHAPEDTLFEDAIYLSNRVLPYNSDPLFTASFDFTASETKPDSILSIDLPADFAMEYFNMLYRASTDTSGNALDSLASSSKLLFKKPLVMAPGLNNQGLFQFDLSNDTTALYVEMTNDKADTTFLYKFDFKDEGHYTHLSRDRSSSTLSDLTTEYTPSANAGENSYLDLMAGVYPKVSLAPLLEFIEENGLKTVNSAYFDLTATTPTNAYLSNISRINAFYITNTGRIDVPGANGEQKRPFAIVQDNSYYSTIQTLLSLAINDDLEYKANIALFTQNLFDNFDNEEDFITEEIVLINPTTNYFDQTILINSEVKLTLYYTSIKE